MDGRTFSWAGHAWATRIPRDPLHQDDRRYWYDEGAVRTDSEGVLHLGTRYNPRVFGAKRPLYGAGYAVSETVFRHGRFEICARLPKGPWLWPAFWGISPLMWPPEVDMFEGYSNAKGSYRKFQWLNPLAKWAVCTNAFYGASGRQAGARQHRQLRPDPAETFEFYWLEWRLKYMAIGMGNHEVRRFTESRLLEPFDAHGLKIVINNAVRNDAPHVEGYPDSDFQVRYFVHKPA